MPDPKIPPSRIFPFPPNPPLTKPPEGPDGQRSPAPALVGPSTPSGEWPTYSEDYALAQAAVRGDEDAWRRILDPLYDRVLSFILATGTDNEDEAKDLRQTICLCLVEGIAKYEGRARLKRWISRVALLRVKDWQRRHLGKLRDLSSLSPEWSDGDGAEDESGALSDAVSYRRLNHLAVANAMAEADRGSALVRLHSGPARIDWETGYVDEFLENEGEPTPDERRRAACARHYFMLGGGAGDGLDPHLKVALRRAFHRLRERDQAVLRLWLERSTAKETGTELGLSEDAAEKQVKRALVRLGEGFKGWRDGYDNLFVGNRR